MNGAKSPIKNDAMFLRNYFGVIQKYIEPFSEVYEKLDLKGLCKKNKANKRISKKTICRNRYCYR